MNPPQESRRVCSHCGAVLPALSRASGCVRCMLKTAMKRATLADSGAQETPAPAATGIVFGDYVLEQEIAHGGMGVVYRARQKGLDRTVAVKLLLLGRHASAASVDRFRREARSAAALRHPNIVAIYEVGECEGQQFFSMEYIEGWNLAEVLRQGLPLSRQAAEHACTIAETIHYAHQPGVLHRDLKPSNVLVDLFGTLRITDFGLAKRLDGTSDLTESGSVLGSPNYLAPEAAAGKSARLGPTSDIYSVGAILYEFLTGRPPFLAASLPETLVRIRDAEPVAPRVLNPGVPRDLNTICLKCLEKDSAARYPTAQALADDLRRWIENRPIQARPTSPFERSVKWARRQPRLAAMTVATALAILGTLAILVVANVQTRAAQREASQRAEESRQRLVRLNVLTGNNLADAGDGYGALLWYAEALNLEQNHPEREDVHRRRFAATLRDTPSLLAQFWQFDEAVTQADFTADGHYLVMGSDGGRARIWDTVTGQPGSSTMMHKSAVCWVRFIDQGRSVATASADGSLHFWDANGNALGPGITVLPGWVTTAMSYDARWIVAATTNGLVRVETAAHRIAGAPLPLPYGVKEVSLSADGARVAVLGTNSVARFWDFATGQTCGPDMDLGSPVRLSELSSDGSRFICALGGSAHQSVVIWDVAKAHKLLEVHTGSDLFGCLFSPDGRRFVASSWDGTARVYDASSGLPVCDVLRHLRGVMGSVFSPDARKVATHSWDTTGRVWDVQTGRAATPMLWHAGYVLGAWFRPDGRQLLTSSEDHTVRLWTLAQESSARLILRHAREVRNACFSPDGKQILTASLDGSACVWDRATGTLLDRQEAGSAVVDACFDARGERVAFATANGSVLLWKPGDTQAAHRLFQQPARVNSLALSPDGEQLVTASADKTARVWSCGYRKGPLTPPFLHAAPNPFRQILFRRKTRPEPESGWHRPSMERRHQCPRWAAAKAYAPIK